MYELLTAIISQLLVIGFRNLNYVQIVVVVLAAVLVVVVVQVVILIVVVGFLGGWGWGEGGDYTEIVVGF